MWPGHLCRYIFVLFKYFAKTKTDLEFQTASGELSAEKAEDLLSMNFPARPPVEAKPPDILSEALRAEASYIMKSRDLLAVFDHEGLIQNMTPDLDKLKQIKSHFALIVSTPGEHTDFVSRFFAPNAGVNEDPVTGSAHCTLISYWAKRLHKNKLHAYQVERENFFVNIQGAVSVFRAIQRCLQKEQFTYKNFEQNDLLW